MDHHIHPELLNHRVLVSLVGVGGNGSQMLTGLARLNHAITALGHPGLHVTAYDDDQVSESNVGRQLFSRSDVGLNKASVLVHRVNVYYGTNWSALPCRYGGLNHGSLSLSPLDAQILITCVDSKEARRVIDLKTTMNDDYRKPYYWLDLGNREADGQVVLGEPQSQKNRDSVPRLPTVMELFREMADASIPEDNTPSCSLAEALERQELFINQAVATSALQLLWQLFRFGKIDWHGSFINLKTGTVRPLLVDPDGWARIRGEA